MATKIQQSKQNKTSKYNGPSFEATRLDGLYAVLDAIAWLDCPNSAEISQFSALDPRTVGKLIKNAQGIGLIDRTNSGIILLTSYPFKGRIEEKESVVKEALLKMPLLINIRQFMALGDTEDVAMRKASTLCKYLPYDAKYFAPLMTWARILGVLKAGQIAEDLVDEAEAQKIERHKSHRKDRVAFISHSSEDKPFVRQLASDLNAAGISVWLDEQRIKVGESIPERISQGLASSDYFLLAVSNKSIRSEWVKKELNSALVKEVQKRSVHVLPLKLDDAAMPNAISDKKYADFSQSYKEGLATLKGTLMEDFDD